VSSAQPLTSQSIDFLYLLQVLIKPSPFGPRTSEWHVMQTPKQVTDNLKIKIIVRMDRPQNLKHCG
jgi:hypothetical protein